MLQHYSPYKVAENFNMLASLAPGRVDLGVGKALADCRSPLARYSRGLTPSKRGVLPTSWRSSTTGCR